MSDDKPESDLALIARQLLEMNQKLDVLPVLQRELEATKLEAQETKTCLSMIQGWMTGQEDVSAAQARRLNWIKETLDDIARRMREQGDRNDAALGLAADLKQQFQGVVALSQSTFDIVTDLKAAQGGAHEDTNSKAVSGQ